MMRLMLISLAILFVAVSGWFAAPGAGDDQNAATYYRKAFALLPAMSQSEQAVLANALTAPLDETALGLLRRSDPALQEWRRGTLLPRCDWDRDWQKEQAFPDALPQDQVSRLICLRARSFFEQGRGREATSDLIALIVMARHIGRNRTALELVLQFAFEGRAVLVAGAYLPRQNAETVRDLAAQLNRLPEPGNLREAMRHEKEFMLGWLRRQLEKSNRDKAYELLRQSCTEEQTQAVLRAAGGEVVGILKLLDEAVEQQEEVGRILMLPADQFPVALAAFRRKHEATNPLTTALTSSLEGMRYGSMRVQALFAMLRRAIAMTLEGPERRKAFQDPFGDGPFLYEPFEGGFELRSKLQSAGRAPVVLTVGMRKKK